MYRSVAGGFGRQARLGENEKKVGFSAKTPPKINFRGPKPKNELFLCKNTTFLLSKLFSRMKLKFRYFFGLRIFCAYFKMAISWPLSL